MHIEKYGQAPNLKYIKENQKAHAILVNLRSAVAPILDNNLLPHFTDHSVSHSDSLTVILDELIEPLQRSDQPLNEHELIVIYSACYLHDIGMQYEKAYETQVIQKLELNQPWQDLSDDTKRNLLRKHHHSISAEMIMKSVRAKASLVGIPLTNDYYPDRVASICEAHGVDFGSERYLKLTVDGLNMRMALLAGLLRVVDILDESRRRAAREIAHTLDLDQVSQTHWWRNYYTEGIEFLLNEHSIKIWFDFPPDHLDEYKEIIPELQIPWIELELLNQGSVFSKYGFSWSLTFCVVAKEYNSTEVMPDSVLSEMTKELNRRRVAEAEKQRRMMLEHFYEAWPLINRQLVELNTNKETLPLDDYLREVSKIATNMWELGGKWSALTILRQAFNQHKDKLDVPERINIGMKLGEMSLDEETADISSNVLHELEPIINSLPNSQQFDYWRLRARYSFYNCNEGTPEEIQRAIELAPNNGLKNELEALLVEWYMLQGDSANVIGNTDGQEYTL